MSSTPRDEVDRRFLWLAAALATATIALRLWISSREWFAADDFYFLHFVQSLELSWKEVFAPSAPRMIGAYRPLGLEAYFALGFKLFGFTALGYYALGLLAQLATAFVTYRIARQLKLGLHAAMTSALLVIVAAPALTDTYGVNVHNYLLAGLCTALSVSLSIDALAGRSFAQLGAIAALIVGLLCNEVCAVIPFVVLATAVNEHGVREHRMRAELSALRMIAAAVVPSAIVTALFVDFRFSGVALRQENWFYDVDFGADMLWNTLGNLSLLAGGAWQLAVFALALVSSLAWLVGRASSDTPSRMRAPAGALLIAAIWLGVGLLPFAVLAFPSSRFALVLLAPFALVLGALLDAILLRAPSPRVVLLATVVVIAATVPWQSAFARALHPEGAVHLASFLHVRDVLARRAQGAALLSLLVEIDYGVPGLADAAALERFRWQTFGGDLVRAAAPQANIRVVFRDLSANTAPSTNAAPSLDAGVESVRFALKPDLSLLTSEGARLP